MGKPSKEWLIGWVQKSGCVSRDSGSCNHMSEILMKRGAWGAHEPDRRSQSRTQFLIDIDGSFYPHFVAYAEWDGERIYFDSTVGQFDVPENVVVGTQEELIAFLRNCRGVRSVEIATATNNYNLAFLNDEMAGDRSGSDSPPRSPRVPSPTLSRKTSLGSSGQQRVGQTLGKNRCTML
jgi:hypothetical protein